MDVSFSQSEIYLAESPARLEETTQSLYADEKPKEIKRNVESHSKLAETVGIENTIMLNPEDLAKATSRNLGEESSNRDFKIAQSYAVQARTSGTFDYNNMMRRGPGARRPTYENRGSPDTGDFSSNPAISVPETRTSVIRGLQTNRSQNAQESDASSEADLDAMELRCYEQVEKDNANERFSRNMHYHQSNDARNTMRPDSPGHISEKFSRSAISSNRAYQMEGTSQANVRDAQYSMRHPPEFTFSQFDPRGKVFYERPGLMATPFSSSGMISHGYSLNPKFNIADGLFVQTHGDLQSGYPGYLMYEARSPMSSAGLPKDGHLSSEQDVLNAKAHNYPSPLYNPKEEEASSRQHSSEQQDRESHAKTDSSEATETKHVEENRNNKSKRNAGGKSENNVQCTQCSKKFGSSSALAKHKATHSDERKYICSICEKGFKRQDHLNGHMMTHRDKKPYECKFCDKSYCDHRSLKRHYENYHPNSEKVPPIATSVAGHKATDADHVRGSTKREGHFTPPEKEERQSSPLTSQSRHDLPPTGIVRKRSSNSACSNSSDDLTRRADNHSPHQSFFEKPQSAVSMLKQVMDCHELKEKHGIDEYTRSGYYAYPDGFNRAAWLHPYQAQVLKMMSFPQPPLLIQQAPFATVRSNPYCPTDPPQLVPSYPGVNHNTSNGGGDALLDEASRIGSRKGDGDGYVRNRNSVAPTDPTSIAISNAKEAPGEVSRQVQYKDGSTAYPPVIQWKTVSVGKENHGMPAHSSANNPPVMQFSQGLVAAGNMVKRDRPRELNITIPTSHGDKRPHEMMEDDHQSKRLRPPPPSPASVNMAKEGLLKLADSTVKLETPSHPDDVFKNPPSTPPRKPRPRPEPINLSFSNLQYSASALSPPIYTPPPMLSPRSIFHVNHSSLTPRCSGTPQTPGKFFLSGNRSRKNSGEDEGDVPELIIPEPKINIGPAFQADVPSNTEPSSGVINDKHRAAVCWVPFEQETRKRADEIEAFLDMACSVAVFGGGSNKEYALHVLYRLKGDIKLAVRHILASRSAIRKEDGLAGYHYDGSERWSSKERLKFREALDKHGKDFFLIAKEINTKTVAQCVEFYYIWKACRPEGMRSRTRYAETESEPDIYEEFSDADEGESTYIFECDFPECHSKFISRQALNGHIRVHGGSFMRPSEPKRTKVKTTTGSDSNSSSGSVPASVPRTVTKPSKLSKPAQSSTTAPVANGDGTLPEFPCKVCGRIFNKIKSRSAHMKTHVKRNDDESKS